ncbi:MAG: hypothetical protein KatS3mg096_047 [Candidatus Parcubacteria bacterium]|nr:MAG: hypothetical protein KatS3mg096_047 [Candidatus Parcubacteria bacterium]
MKKITLIILCLAFLSLTKAAIVECTVTTTPKGSTTTICTWQDFIKSVNNLIKTVVIVSYWTAFLLVSIGAFLMMFAGPNEGLLKRGREMIRIAIWGYILVLLSGIVFEIILEFFSPQFALAQDLTPRTFFNPLKTPIMSELKCGQNAPPLFNSPSLGRVYRCAFQAIGLLKNVAVVLLAGAIIWAAVYLIATPLFGLKQISRAYKILIWSTVGLIIILLADLIRAQIERLVR